MDFDTRKKKLHNKFTYLFSYIFLWAEAYSGARAHVHSTTNATFSLSISSLKLSEVFSCFIFFFGWRRRKNREILTFAFDYIRAARDERKSFFPRCVHAERDFRLRSHVAKVTQSPSRKVKKAPRARAILFHVCHIENQFFSLHADV